MRQQNLFPPPLLFHGGELALGRRKTLRPIDPRRSLHCTLKAQRNDLRDRRAWIISQARSLSQDHHARLYEIAVNADHIHFVLKVPSRRAWRAFIRGFTAQLSRAFGRSIFALLPFTRIVSWGRDFLETCAYVRKNEAEAAGARAYEKRQDWYARWRPSGLWSRGKPL